MAQNRIVVAFVLILATAGFAVADETPNDSVQDQLRKLSQTIELRKLELDLLNLDILLARKRSDEARQVEEAELAHEAELRRLQRQTETIKTTLDLMRAQAELEKYKTSR